MLIHARFVRRVPSSTKTPNLIKIALRLHTDERAAVTSGF